jgi:CRP-like cAMP-binding protein
LKRKLHHTGDKTDGFETLISAVSKYISLTPDEINLFSSLIQIKSIATNSYLLKEGAVCRYESFVTKGCLKTFYQDENGFEHILDFSIEGWWASDLYSLLTQTASTLNIKATEDTEVLQISIQKLELLYARVPKFERFFRILFQNAFIAQRDQINLSLYAPAEQRYKIFMKKKPYAIKRFTQKDIASYLGVTPQFLSSMKKKLR